MPSAPSATQTMSTAEELKLLLDSSGDDFDFLVPIILDGSSTGLEGASGGGASSSPEACGSTLEVCVGRWGGRCWGDTAGEVFRLHRDTIDGRNDEMRMHPGPKDHKATTTSEQRLASCPTPAHTPRPPSRRSRREYGHRPWRKVCGRRTTTSATTDR